MRCILVGNYGVGNVGDEALKEYFLSAFPDIQWTVLSAHPKIGELPRLPAGLRSFLRMNWWQTIRAIKQADAVVFGGGSLFTDVESSFACFVWFVHAFTAWTVRTPYLLAFQGIGPLKTTWGRMLTRWVLKHAAFLSVRDPFSESQVKQFDMHTKMVQTFDPVILSAQKEESVGAKNEIIIIPRHNAGQEFFDTVEEAMENLPHAIVHIISMQPDDYGEAEICQDLSQMIGGRATILPATSMKELAEHLRNAILVVTARYHGALAALACRAPVIIVSQAATDKLSSLRPYANGDRSIDDAVTLAKAGEVALHEALRDIASTL